MATEQEKHRKISYRQMLKRIRDKFVRSRCLGMSAELGFWFLYSLFPFLIFLVAISSFFPFTPSPGRILHTLERSVPTQFYHFLAPIIEQVLVRPNGWLAAGTLVLALWSASGAVSSLISTLNEIYEVEETRPLWKSMLLALCLTLTLVFVYVLAFTLVVLGPIISGFIVNHVGLSETIKDFFNLMRIITTAITMLVAFGLIYAVAPNAKWHWRTVLPGAFIATVAFHGVSVGFSYYLQNFAYYNRFYGTLGAVVALMTWLYLVGLVILIGGLVDGEIRCLLQKEEQVLPPPGDLNGQGAS
jgi:membrane protein